MKKTSVINLIVIIGLLILCVMTLVAIYGTAPDSSTILLFEEDFNVLDEAKWRQENHKCRLEGDQCHYTRTDEGSGYAQDSILHINLEPIKKLNARSKRESSECCQICFESESSNVDCFSSLHSTAIQTKNLFEAKFGRIEVRAKIPFGNWMKPYIGIINNNSDSEQDLKGFNFVEVLGDNIFKEKLVLKLILGPVSNQTTMESDINKGDFHVYKIEWDNNKILFKVDEEEISSTLLDFANSTAVLDTSLTNSTEFFSQPFHIRMGVEAREKISRNESDRENFKDSSQYSHELNEDEILQVDYIRLFKIV